MSIIGLIVLLLFLQDFKNDPKGTVDSVALFVVILIGIHFVGNLIFN